jgi:hypothetical protein
VSEGLGITYKAALALVKRLPHQAVGKRLIVARVVVLAEFGLDARGNPLQGVRNPEVEP